MYYSCYFTAAPLSDNLIRLIHIPKTGTSFERDLSRINISLEEEDTSVQTRSEMNLTSVERQFETMMEVSLSEYTGLRREQISHVDPIPNSYMSPGALIARMLRGELQTKSNPMRLIP